MSVARISRSVAREWLADNRPLALATLVETVGSAPLEPGSMMLVDGDGKVEGSVTGGCVEGAVAERALEAIGGATRGLRLRGLRASRGRGGSDVERIAAPCGLDLGARTPEETAVFSRSRLRRRSARALPVR